MSRLTKALHFFLGEQYDMDEYFEDEEGYIEELKLISANVINDNGDATTCPYKNYSMEEICPYGGKCHWKDELYMACDYGSEEIYDKFYEDIVIK